MKQATSIPVLSRFVMRVTVILLVTLVLLAGCNLQLATPGQATGTATATSGAQAGQSTEGPAASATLPSESAAPTPTPTPSPIPTPTPVPPLPIDPIVESYFGPLPTATQVVAFEHNEIRALYLGVAANLDYALKLARETEINAVVFDLKESNGVKYKSQVPLAVENGLVHSLFNLQAAVERCHAEGVKVIGRIVCFKDPFLAEARPDLAIQDKNGNALLYKLEGKKPFVNPYNQDVWQYNIDLAKEAISYGVDEIQFDYVRFPTGGTTTGATPYFGEEGTVPTKVQAINRFLQFARVQIQDELGVPLGADVFAIVMISRGDGNRIGQDWASLGLLGLDRISPMIYPSHYANNSSGHYTGNGVGQQVGDTLYTKPDLYPYDVMYKTLKVGQEMAAAAPGYNVAIAPYLQAFTASYLPNGYYMTYGAKEIREQIQAVEDAGYTEWVLWNSRASYPAEAFRPETNE